MKKITLPMAHLVRTEGARKQFNMLMAIAVMATAGRAMAAEVGVGLSLKQDENGIFIPVKARENLFIEGFFRQNSSKASPSNSQSQGQNSAFSASRIGLGVFWQKAISDGCQIYAGPRMAYTTMKYSATFPALGDGSGPTFTFEDKHHGTTLTPTLGFEYFPVKHVSIGGEVGYEYTRMNSTFNQHYGESLSREGTNRGTVSSVILRYYF